MDIDVLKIVILGLIVTHTGLEILVEWLNLSHSSQKLPAELAHLYDAKRYIQSQKYLQSTTRFNLLKTVLFNGILLLMMTNASFGRLDQWLRIAQQSPLITGLLFWSVLFVLQTVLSWPFSAYRTFVIEERFGFNRSSVRTFVLDRIKGLALTAVIGLPLLATLLWFFETQGDYAWIRAWILMTATQILLVWLGPTVLMPLFNRFTPLPEGELKNAIENLAQRENFQLQGLYTMDGSRRSSKANAFFTGFGSSKRIVLFDTLLTQHSTEELLAVLAHEIGHYKKKHILQSLLLGTLSSGLLFWLLGKILHYPHWTAALGFAEGSVYSGMLLFSLLYTPLQTTLSIASACLSRRNEFQADAYAVQSCQGGENLISALKKLSMDSLSNLTPHPLKVFLEYSHPPLLERIAAIRRTQPLPS